MPVPHMIRGAKSPVQMPNSVSTFVFGNSLVNYAEGGPQTNIAVWMNRMAQADGTQFAFGGGYGFLRNFAETPAQPNSNWGFAGVTPSWDDGSQAFSGADLDAILITPDNFIQDVSPTTNYRGDDGSPVDATVEVVRSLTQTQPGTPVYIYEGWADMAAFAGGAEIATGSGLAQYHAFNLGAYHDWFESYVGSVRAAVPGADVRLLPVATVLSEVLTTTLRGVSSSDLYVDSAPHGTESLYFLAAMIVYSELYDRPVPADMDVPSQIIPAIANALPTLSAQIADLLDVSGGGGAPIVVPQPEPEPEPQPEPEPEPEPAPTPEPGPSGGEVANDSYTVGVGGTTMLDVLANDPVRGTLSFVDPPLNGSARILDGQIAYDPAGTGTDSFTYTVTFADRTVAEAFVTVNVTAQGATTAPATPVVRPEPTPEPEPAPEPVVPQYPTSLTNGPVRAEGAFSVQQLALTQVSDRGRDVEISEFSVEADRDGTVTLAYRAFAHLEIDVNGDRFVLKANGAREQAEVTLREGQNDLTVYALDTGMVDATVMTLTGPVGMDAERVGARSEFDVVATIVSEGSVAAIYDDVFLFA